MGEGSEIDKRQAYLYNRSFYNGSCSITDWEFKPNLYVPYIIHYCL